MFLRSFLNKSSLMKFMQIKTLPEDFVVREVAALPLGKGSYDYYLLEKRGLGTLEVVQQIADSLHIRLQDVGFAGNKDTRAVTFQYISLRGVPRKQVESLSLSHIRLTYQGSGSERITLGDLEGNAFTLVVRDLDEQKSLSISNIKNYFDDQRFGVEQKNIPVGKALVQGRFKDACDLLKLSYNGKNYVEALRKVQKKLLRFYVASYQSYLWNTVANNLNAVATVPLVGFLTELTGEIGALYKNLLEHEGIRQTDFLFKPLPGLMVEGDERPLYVVVKNFSYAYADDDLHPKKFKCILRFELQKGAYATMVVKQLFK
jgi:tRNA pseudouridine13 synthase